MISENVQVLQACSQPESTNQHAAICMWKTRSIPINMDSLDRLYKLIMYKY